VTNNGQQKNTHNTKDQATRIPLKTGCELRCSGRVKIFLFHLWHPLCFSCYKHGDKSWLWHTEHTPGHLWHRYSGTVYQVMVATVKLQLNCYFYVC
jgi:hypothetical protein